MQKTHVDRFERFLCPDWASVQILPIFNVATRTLAYRKTDRYYVFEAPIFDMGRVYIQSPSSWPVSAS